MKRMMKRVVGVAVALCMMISSTAAVAAKTPGAGEMASYSISSRAVANLALGKTATASDVENGTSFTADLAVDGLTNTRWASNASYSATKPAKWLKVDFGEVVSFDTVEIKFEQQNIVSYRIEVSDNDADWTPVYESSSKITSVDQSILLNTPASGKYIRVYATNYDGNWPSVSIFELAVYNYAGGGDGPEEPTGNYTIYPIPQKVTDSETVADLTGTVNVVKEDGIDAVTKNRIDEVLSDNGLTAQYGAAAVDGMTNLFIGVNGSGKAADSHADVPRDVFAEGANKYDMHVVKVFDNGDIVILGKDTDAAFYGLATLDQMLEQNENGKLKVSTIEDYSFQKYRGCVEGYYGYPWSVEGTLDWFDFAKRYKMNIFLYGPKTDPYHLGKWDEDYPTQVTAEESKIGIRTQEEMTLFAEKAAECNVDFVWVAHPAMKKPIDFTNESTVDEGVDRLMVKFDHMYQMGVRQFGVFVDDIDPNVINPMTTKEMQAYMIDQVQNRLYETYNKEDTAPEDMVKNVFFTPVTYATASSGASSYLPAFRDIHEDIEVCFTGNNVFSSIRNSDAATFKNWIGRTPVLWWNYPVNDNMDSVYYTCPINYYYTQDSNPTNLKGVISNPMNFSQSSKVAFFGVADYTWNPGAFDAVENWNNCFAGIFPDDPEMAAALKIVYGSLNNGYEPSELTRLYTLFNNGDQGAAAMLKNKMFEMMAAIEKLETLKQSDDPAERLLVEEAQTSINKLYDMAAAIGGAMAAISSNDPLEQIHGYYLAKAANERLNIARNPRYEIIALEGSGEDIYYNILQAIPSDSKMKGFVTTAMNRIAGITPPTVDADVADIQGIAINPSQNVEVQQGTSRQFTAAADSSNANVDDVIWSVEGATAAGTAISYNGVLTVDNNELSPTITVKAVSAYDSNKTASVVITVTDRVYIDPTVPVNLGPSATVLGGSGNPAAGEGPENALDDNDGTKWCPGDGTRFNQWMAFDVGAEKVVSKWQMVHAGVEDTVNISSAYSLQILKDANATPEQLSNKSYLGDSNNWTTVAQYTGNSSNVTNYTFDEPVTARYFRLYITDGCQPSVRYPATRIFECRVYGVDKETVDNTYGLTVDPDLVNGTLETDASNYEAGAKVNIRVIPDEGYQLKAGSLKFNDTAIEGASFIMPEEDVFITAEFEQAGGSSEWENVQVTVTPNQAQVQTGNTQQFNATVTGNLGGSTTLGSIMDGAAILTGECSGVDLSTVATIVDGDVTTKSVGSPNTNNADNAVIVFTLPEAKAVSAWDIYGARNLEDLPFGAKACTLYYYNGTEYVSMGSVAEINADSGVREADPQAFRVTLDQSVTAQKFKLVITDWWVKNGKVDWKAIWDVALYGEVAQNASPIVAAANIVMALADAPSQEVRWTVEGANSADTKINAAGLLTVGADETADTLTVKATSVLDENAVGTATVTVIHPVTTYTITVNSMDNGSVTADKQTAAEGETVTLTVTPDDGYRLVEGSLKANGVAIEGTSFTMPAGDVAISAEFAPVSAPSDDNLAIGAEVLGHNRTPFTGEEVAKAFDGDEATKWCAQTNNDSWAVFDIKTAAEVNRLRVVHASGAAVPEQEMLNTVAFSLQALDQSKLSEADFLAMDTAQKANVMADNSYWTNLISYTGNNLGVTDDSFASVGARRIYRMRVTDGDNSSWADTLRIYEIQLFGNGQSVTKYNVTIGSMTNGTVTADKQTAAAGETVTLTVTPNEGYRLVEGSLKVNGTAVAGASFTMPAGNVTVTAQFEQIPATLYNVTIGSMTNGTVTADKQTAAAGETITLTVTPNEGYRLVEGSLKVNGTAVAGASFTMPAGNVTVTAQFEQIPATLYNVTIGSMTNGTVTADKQTAAAGETVTLTVTPNEGYRLVEGSLKVNGTAVAGASFTMPAGNVTVTAQFEQIPATLYNVTIGSMTNGTVTADKQTAAAGETVTLTVTPNEGYRVKAGSLKVNGTAVEGNTFVMPAQDAAVTAIFEKIPSGVITAVLESAIEKAIELKEGGALNGTMQAVVNEFNAALEAAQALIADSGNATQSEINAATVRLLSVMAKVDWKQGDTTLLEIAVQVAETIEPNLSLYVEAGKQEFIDALNAARDILNGGNAWDDEIQAAAMDLIEAMNNLRMAANKDILNGMINNAKTYDLSKYTEGSANAVRAALAKAEALAADENAAQDEVDAAARSLKAALGGLVLANTGNAGNNGTTAPVGDGSTPTKTGDIGVSALAALALISAAGVLVLARKKRS